MKLKLLLGTLLCSTLTLSQVPTYVPSNGLVGWWSFTGSGTDATGNGNTATLVNGAAYSADRFSTPSSCVTLDGVNDYLSLPSGNTSLNITANLSVSFWIKTSDLAGLLVSFGDNVNTNSGGYLSGINGGNVGNGKFSAAISSGAWNGMIGTINNNQWRHVVYTYESGILKIYIDNILNNIVTGVSQPLNWTGSRVIGCRHDLIMTSATNYIGLFDDLGVWNRALTACEVSELFNSQILSTSGVDVVNACNTFTWIDGNTYTNSNNTATHVLTNAAGCDSTVTLNLILNNSNTGTDVVEACDTYTWIDGNTYTSSNNSATYILTNVSGCDSIVTLNLTLSNSNAGVDVVSACDSYTWIDGNTYTTSNNSATWLLSNINGCDSLVTLDLTLNQSTSSILNETALDSYTLNGQTYNQSGTYQQTLTNSMGCDSVITLNLELQFTGIAEELGNSFSIYPNPATEFITIESQSFSDIYVIDILGNIIKQEKKEDYTVLISLKQLSNGTYFIKQDSAIVNLVKQ